MHSTSFSLSSNCAVFNRSSNTALGSYPQKDTISLRVRHLLNKSNAVKQKNKRFILHCILIILDIQYVHEQWNLQSLTNQLVTSSYESTPLHVIINLILCPEIPFESALNLTFSVLECPISKHLSRLFEWLHEEH